MSHFNSRRLLVLVLVLMLGLCAVSVQAQEYRYRFVSLGGIEVPQGFDPFFWVGSLFLLSPRYYDLKAINNSGKIYGHLFDEFGAPHIAVYAHGKFSIIPEVSVFEMANEGGTIGGSVLVDAENFIFQAALFHGSASGQYHVELIPPLPGEFFGIVMRLNDSGKALVSSNFETLFLYNNGKVQLVDFGPAIANPDHLNINNQGIISGSGDVDGIASGFRFDPRTDEVTPLNPLQTDSHSQALDINELGEVLGYSFGLDATRRIGVWDRKGEFKTYFVEGTQEFPTFSNNLLFNNNNLIVITHVSAPLTEVGSSYLVPKPGVRLNLADLVENLPSGQGLQYIFSLNDHGDMIGIDCPGFVCSPYFLLHRIGAGNGD